MGREKRGNTKKWPALRSRRAHSKRFVRACKMRAAASFACAVNERCPAGEIISNLTEAEQPVALISHTGRSAKWYRCMEILWKMALRLILKDIFDVHAESAHSENIISKPEMGPWFCFLIYKHAALDCICGCFVLGNARGKWICLCGRSRRAGITHCLRVLHFTCRSANYLFRFSSHRRDLKRHWNVTV
jgi:hypothetical protein